MDSLTFLEKELTGPGKKQIDFKPGDTVKVYTRYKEGDKNRVQQFEGVVTGISGGGINTNFTVRKVSYGVGVERIFPLYSPAIEKIEVVQRTKVKRAKLYYLRGLSTKSSRLKRARETKEMTQGAEPAPQDEDKPQA
ncbi:MAG: 50S ribosomal protein L19 [Deltaproteobacteria bacterium]|nr:50S ribosomal protein L19 [Deltaproteobacteria bacterium]MCL5277321.1 50S ribosomal protein L19 [Deltaproteobacteria bacterium]